jgi:aminoglycoside 2'-N-acetyltransferase I
MEIQLRLEVIHANQLSAKQLTAIHALCNRAYEEDLTSLFNTFIDATYVLGYAGETIVSHAMWMTRWLQAGESPLLRTAYLTFCQIAL